MAIPLTTAAVAPHPMLLPGWVRPRVPCGYDALVCCDYGAAHKPAVRFELDYFNNTRCDYASELLTFTVAWPWASGFTPAHDDWLAIGIDIHDCR